MAARFTKTLVEAALRDSRASLTYDQTDAACAGLTLRVGPRGAVWGYKAMSRGRLHRLAIGPVGKESGAGAISLDDARDIANAARRELREGRELTPGFLRAQLVRLGLSEPEPVAPPPDPAAAAARAQAAADARLWTLAQAREAYLAEVERTLRWDTWNDYRKLLHIPELRFLDNERVCRITRQQLAEIVADVHKTGRERHAEHLASVLRPFWTYLSDDAVTRQSGVTHDMARLRAPPRSKGEMVRPNGKVPGKYIATSSEIGRLLTYCEDEAFGSDISLALTIMILTGQRRRAIASALIVDFVPWMENDGWGVWSMGPPHRKTADRRGDTSRHAMPLPPYLWSTIQGQMAVAHELGSPYLFPQIRPGRARPAGDGHLSPSTLNHRMHDLSLKASPHDVRRAMTNTLQNEFRIARSDVKLLADHAEGIPCGDTLERHYTDDDRLDLKAPVMKIWFDWCYAQEKEAFGERLSSEDVRSLMKETRKRRTAAGVGRKRSYGVVPVSTVFDPVAENRRRATHVATAVGDVGRDSEWTDHIAEVVAKRRRRGS